MTKIVSNSKKRKRNQMVICTLIFVLVVVALATLCSYLFMSNRTHYSVSSDDGQLEMLICETTNPIGPYFLVSRATSTKHELRVVYSNDLIEKISYNYAGIFVNHDDAAQAEAVLHAKYNLYMGDNGLSKDLLSVFSGVDGNSYDLRLIGEKNDLNAVTAKLFYIDDFDGDYQKYTEENLTRIYENRGFSCRHN